VVPSRLIEGGNMKYRFAASVILVLIVLTTLVGCTWGKREPVINIEGIKKIAQLATIEYNITVIEKQEKYGALDFFKLFPSSALFFVKGKVKGSVDLDKISEFTVDEQNRQVKIVFPNDAILVSDPEIGPDDIKMMDCQKNIFVPIKGEDITKAQAAAIKKLKDTAEADGIRSKTKEEAILVLSEFIGSFGYEAHVEFK
jgi:hypothetical protein